MALHLYYRVKKCHNTWADVSEITLMSWHSDNNIQGNVFYVHVNVSIDTKMCKCEMYTYNIKNISGTCHIARAQRALVVR